MIDLTRELEAYAADAAEGAAERFAGASMREQLGERIARGRRRVNGLAVAAAALLAVAATTVATPPDAPEPAQPSPTMAATADDPNDLNDRLPSIFAYDYLVDMRGKYEQPGKLSCNQIPSVPISTDGSPFPGFMAGLPRWLEINRIYGLPNELPASYPIPLYSSDGSGRYNQSLKSIPKLYPADARVVVTLIATDGSWWGFTAEYAVREDMPFEAPGMFVSLSPDADCSGGARSADGARIPAGVYAAREMTAPLWGPGVTTVRDLGYVQVVTGLPSIPQLNVTK